MLSPRYCTGVTNYTLLHPNWKCTFISYGWYACVRIRLVLTRNFFSVAATLKNQFIFIHATISIGYVSFQFTKRIFLNMSFWQLESYLGRQKHEILEEETHTVWVRSTYWCQKTYKWKNLVPKILDWYWKKIISSHWV